MTLMLDDDELPPVCHTGGRCKACGYMVEPTHDAVSCAYALAAERDSLRALVRDLLRWAAVETKAAASDRFRSLKDLAAKLHAIPSRRRS